MIHLNFKQTWFEKSFFFTSNGPTKKSFTVPFGMMNPWKGILSVARCSKPAGATQLILWTSQRNASQKGKFCLSAKLTLRDLPKMEWKLMWSIWSWHPIPNFLYHEFQFFFIQYITHKFVPITESISLWHSVCSFCCKLRYSKTQDKVLPTVSPPASNKSKQTPTKWFSVKISFGESSSSDFSK